MAPWLSTLLLAAILIPVIAREFNRPSTGPFHVAVYDNGKYDVKVNGVNWLSSGPTFFNNDGKRYCTKEGTLKLVATRSESGRDHYGLYNRTIFSYRAGQLMVNTTIKTYTKPPLPFAIFSQRYVTKASQTQGKDPDDIISSFPSFGFQRNNTVALGYLAYGGYMAGWTKLSLDRWSKDANFTTGIEGGPLVLFDKGSNAMVISPLNEFMAASNKKFQDQHISWGIMGLVDSVPSGYTADFIISFSDRGVNQAMRDWGAIMTYLHGKSSKARDSDLTLTHLGYWTDNGAYYYYNTEKGKNYEDTIVDEVAYLKAQGLPVKYLQIDSWFYPKGHVKGTKTWTPEKSIFPDGFKGLYEKTQLPIACHNRYWDNDTTYARYNGGKYNFISDVKTGYAVPDDQQFWLDLFNSTKAWGPFILYEQDWLNEETDRNLALLSNLTLGAEWLTQMGHAAEKHGITIQYCMSYGRHILQSLQIPAVTQARASDDYQPARPEITQYKIGITSMFVDALNLAPSKDTFWSTNVQPGNPYHGYEAAPYLQTLIATLSGGPVGPGDGLGYANNKILTRCCDSDGRVLRGSRSLTIMDKSLKHAAFSGSAPGGRGDVLYSTISDISGHIFGTIIANHITSYYKLVPTDLTPDYPHFPGDMVTYIYDEFGKKVKEWSNQSPLGVEKTQCGDNLCIYYSLPVFKTKGGVQLGLLGEAGIRFSPVSPQRFSNLRFTRPDQLSVHVNVNPQEVVSVWFLTARSDPPEFVVAKCENPSGSTPVTANAYITATGKHGCDKV
ncbi:hypothetical protein RRG08_056560 [Elysia crispata]|uniref:Uncharacterized protein n=1 Tax=Elysia crispata TaxID=231223 RepID=A0AAE0YDU6_9GAST|nr:hypothetical protein RRG08_056560 [Elysia crispata]